MHINEARQAEALRDIQFRRAFWYGVGIGEYLLDGGAVSHNCRIVLYGVGGGIKQGNPQTTT